MSKKKVERKSHLKPFVKYVNYNHMLPTRFLFKAADNDIDFKPIVSDDKMNPAGKKTMKAELKKLLQDR